MSVGSSTGSSRIPTTMYSNLRQVLKKSDDVYNLPTGSSGFSQGERSDCRHEVSKVSLNLRHELGDFQVLYPEVLDIGQCGKLA